MNYRGFLIEEVRHDEDDCSWSEWIVAAPDGLTVSADVSPYCDGSIIEPFIDTWIATGMPPKRIGTGPLTVDDLRSIRFYDVAFTIVDAALVVVIVAMVAAIFAVL